MSEQTMTYKMLEPIRFASIKKVVGGRDEIAGMIDQAAKACGKSACGDPLAIFYGGAVKEGWLIEAGFPVSKPIEKGEVHTRTLEGGPVMTRLFQGDPKTIRPAVLEMVTHLDTCAWSITGVRWEIYHKCDSTDPTNNETEIVVLLHKWERLIAASAEKVLGAQASVSLMQGAEEFSQDSTLEECTTWICSAMQRLDALTDDEQVKCRVVSGCAHVFPQARIDHLRAIYDRSGLDDVLREMYTDFFWYGDPERVGNVLYIRKRPPFDEEGYKKATTPAERRKANCHCKYVRPFLDEVPGKLSPTFCYCGAGWYIRLWEGVLGKPVKVGNLRSLLHGDDECSMTITLPLELEGECHPPMQRRYSDNTL